MKAYRRTRLPGTIDSNLISVPVPLTISNLQNWFRADSLDYLNNSDSVNLWDDISGNNNHASMYTVAEQPTFIENIINGYPVVRFAGSNSLGHTPVSYDQATHFVVWSRTGATNNDAILVYSATVYSYLQYSDQWYAAVSKNKTVAMVADTFFLKACSYDNANLRRYTNGSAEDAEESGLDANYGYIGHPSFLLNGDIAEVIIYDKLLSTGEREAVDSYLNNRYALWV